MKNFYPSVRNLLSPGQVRLLLSGMAVAFVMAVLPGKVFAQAPVISYSTPQTYPVGTAITPLSPANGAGAVAAPAYITDLVTLGSDFVAVSGITVDASGNIYFADGGLGSVYKKLAGGGATVIIASGLADIGAMAADAPGNVYFCAPVEGNVYKIDGGGGITTIGSGFSRPAGVAADGAGNVYVADYNSGLVKEIPASGGSMINIGSGFVAPASVAVDGQDNVYVLDQGNVVEVPANGGSQVTVASGFPGALCLAVDFAGDAYLFDAHSTNLWMIPAGGSESIISSSQYANFLAVDEAGNLYLSDEYDNILNELSPVGGYYINKGLPAGLSFNVSTGTISGTPTTVSAAANYTVTGYNAVGSGTATLTITVNPVPPAISYSTPQTYNAATAITPLSPANTGGAAAAFGYNTTATEIPTGVNDALSLAADKSGNMYIGENGGNISLLPAGGGTATVFATGFAHVYSVAVDASNNVYAADNAHVWKIPAGGGAAVSLGSFSSPVGLAFDPAGCLYVASNGGSNPGVYKMSTDGTGQTRIDNNLQGPAYIAFDTNGNLFIGDQNTGSLYEIPAGGSQTQLASGLSGVVSVKTDLSGNVYVSVFSGRIYCYSPASGLFQIDSNSAYGLMTDANFNLYYASGSGIYKISPNGGYFTNPELPQGLVINQSSGVISGMPAGISPATNYTVTAFNAGGSGSAAINILINPTLPTISYTSPQSYQVGSSISALSPSSSNVASWGYSTGITAVSSGFGAPVDVAADAAGNVYVADFTMNQVEKIPAGGGAPVVFSSGFSQPFGVAADAAGNVYVADAGNNAVKEILAGAGTINTIGSGFNGPSAVAVDGPGNVYVGDTGNGALKEIPAGNGTPVILQSGFASIQGVAVDAAGNVYVADAGASGNGAVYKIPAGGGSMAAVGTGFSRPSGVAVDAGGNIYVTDVNQAVITVIEPGGTQFTVGSGFNHANGVSLDSGGNLYIADSGNGLVKEVKITGGYFLSPLLPAGLTFNNSTGVISGTPATPAPTANYTVTSYNGASSSSAPISITVGAPIISYTSPVAYAAGAAITPLVPTSAGGAVPALSFSSAVTVSTGVTDATCLAMDNAGNLYIGESSGQVSVLAPGSTAATVLATGFGTYIQDGGIAVDASGNVYVADGEFLWKIPAGGGTPVKWTGFAAPEQVYIDAAGNLYVRAAAAGIYKMASDGTNQTQLFSGTVTGMAVDQNGNVFFSGLGSMDKLFEIPAGGTQKTINSNGSRIYTTDPSGNIYIVNYDGSIGMIPANGTIETQVEPAPAISGNTGIMVDSNFNLYIVVNGSIIKASPTGGYFISPELPLGLNIDPATGVISGTPAVAAASSTANYTVKAFNGDAGATATVNITVAPAPAISYATPQTYTVGLPIAPLQPASTGGVVSAPGFNTLTETLNTGITDAVCTAMDNNGNLYIDESSGKISVLAAGSTTATVFATGFNPYATLVDEGIAVDKSGNVYFADNEWLWKIPAGGGTPVKLGSFNEAGGVSTDAAGNVYVRDGTRGIYKMASDGSNITQILNGYSSAVAVDPDGNVFFSSRGSQAKLFEIPAGGAQKTVNPIGRSIYATDPSGNIYMVNGDCTIGMIPANGTIESQVEPALTSLLPEITGITVGPDFNLYIVVNGRIIKAAPTGGYFISPELPVGLNIDLASGAISGTPAAASAAANYTVTAFSNSVGGSATVNITVNTPPAPIISYATPQTYTSGATITPLPPTNTGGAVGVPGFNTITTVSAGVTDATCTAMDKNGNLYIGESSGQVSVLAPGSTTATVFATGFNPNPSVLEEGIAVDRSGNVYFADNISLWKIPAGGGTPVRLSSLEVVAGVSADAAGNVYARVAAQGIYKMASDGSNITQIVSGAFNAMAVDQNGNVFFSGRGSQGKTFEIPAGGVQKTVSPNPGQSYATDPSGNIYILSGDGSIGMIPANGTIETQVEPAPTFSGYVIRGITAGPDFNLYIAVNGDIIKAAPTGGYFISPELPVGLNIDPTSGAISGTPAAVSAAANYTVTAFNYTVGGSATVNITVNALTPAISYSTPQVYVQNLAITPLSPLATNVATPGYLSTATTAGSFSQPYATAVDESGNVYVVDKTANGIYELPAGGGQVTVGTGLNTPAAVAVDKLGNVYTANQGDNTVVEIQAHTGTQTFIGSGYQRPTAVAVDSAGNVFVADVQGAAGVVYKIAPGQSKQLFKSGFISPNGIAIDPAGNVYVSDFGGGPAASMVYQISPDGSTETPINHSFSTATGLAIDATGNLFIADAGNTDIVEYPAGGGSAMTLTAGLTFPFGLSADAAGNLYIADPGAGQVVKLTPAGGYFINRVLPAGLSFNTTTGTVSGTPATASPATNYTVTAYSSLGSGTAAVNIKVNTSASDAALSGLTASNGTLSPGFAPGTTGYNIAVGNGLSTMTVTPTADNPNATITVQGQTVASGTPSQYLTLATGITSVPVVVTSFDHSTTKTYTLNIKEAKSQNANLTSLKRSSGILIPGFTADGTTYTENVGYGTTTMSVIPTAANVNAVITVNGTTVASGSPSPTYNLPAGGTMVITIMVTAQLGDTKTYTLTVNRALSSDASLSGLQISAGTLAPKFEPLTQLDAYGAKVNSSIATIEVTPTATSAEIQSITVNTAAVSSGSPSGPITLSSPTTPVTIVVTAQDGTQRTYMVTITRVINDASLSNLQVDAGTFTPKFQPLTSLNTYSANEANGTNSVNVTPTTTDPGATITINTNTAISGQPYAVATSTGTNPVTIVVTASDGSTTRTYHLTINVAAPPADNTVYQPLGVEKPTDSPMLNNDGITVHQAISPNGDGINDFLQIDNISQYPDNKLSIMNRSGQLIYETKGYDNSSKTFDGHSNKNGQMQLPGTYFYQLDYTVNGITKHKTGFLVLKY